MKKSVRNINLLFFAFMTLTSEVTYASKAKMPPMTTSNLQEMDAFGGLFGDRYKIFLDRRSVKKETKRFWIRDPQKAIDFMGDKDKLFVIEVDAIRADFLYTFEDTIPFGNALIGSYLIEALVLCADNSQIQDFVGQGRLIEQNFTIKPQAYIHNFFADNLEEVEASSELQSMVTIYMQNGNGMIYEINGTAYNEDELDQISKPLEKKYINHKDLKTYSSNICEKFFPDGATAHRTK